jgi:hypothetical protein
VTHACLDAEEIAKTFPEQVAKSQETLAQMERLEKSVVELREFVAELDEQSQPQSIFSAVDKDRADTMKRGLDLIAMRIESKRCRENELQCWFGIGRKVRSKEVGSNAAIWTLASEVLRITEKPHLTDVAELAEFILGVPVSLDRVRGIIRNRRPRYDKMIDAQSRRASVLWKEKRNELDRLRKNKDQKATTERNRRGHKTVAGSRQK